MRLSGKTIVVTGAAHGIGRAYCERLASEGANVAALDIDTDALQRVVDGIGQAGGSAIAIEADVRRFEPLESAM
jgi:2-hydroxycyclohexanecarboxyl-CoA dehydrogenase